MVSKARLDLPDPDRPVNTIMESRGRSSDTSLRLCSRAPRTTSRSATALSALPAGVVIPGHGTPSHAIRGPGQFRAARDDRAGPPVLPVQPGGLAVLLPARTGRPAAGARILIVRGRRDGLDSGHARFLPAGGSGDSG